MQRREISERKPLEETTQTSHLKQIISSLESDVKESNRRNDRLKEEVLYYQARVKSLEAEKNIHIKDHAVEKEELNQRISDLTKKIKRVVHAQKSKEQSLLDENAKLKRDLAVLKRKERKSTSLLKKKAKESEMFEKSKKPKEFEIKFRQLKRTKPMKRVASERKVRVDARSKSALTAREPDFSRLDEIKNMIEGIERTQNEYTQKYQQLLRCEQPNTAEIERLHHLLENNEGRLAEARRIRDRFSSSDLNI